jgi:hypothetical protein
VGSRVTDHEPTDGQGRARCDYIAAMLGEVPPGN